MLGLGEGGYDVLGALGQDIGRPHGAHGAEQEIYVLNPNADIWNKPFDISIPASRRFKVYNTKPDSVYIHKNYVGGDVTGWAQRAGAPDYYMLLSEADRYMLWGYNGPANQLSTSGEQLLANTVSYLLSQ